MRALLWSSLKQAEKKVGVSRNRYWRLLLFQFPLGVSSFSCTNRKSIRNDRNCLSYLLNIMMFAFKIVLSFPTTLPLNVEYYALCPLKIHGDIYPITKRSTGYFSWGKIYILIKYWFINVLYKRGGNVR